MVFDQRFADRSAEAGNRSRRGPRGLRGHRCHKGLDVPKVSAAEVAEKTTDAIVRNDSEVLVDEAAKRVRSLLSGPLDLMYPAH